VATPTQLFPDPCLGGSITGPCHSGNVSSSSPGQYHGGNISSASPGPCLGIRMSSTSPGLATVVTRCTSGVFRLPLASPWRYFPTRAGRFQSCTFGDSAPLRSFAIVLAVGFRRYRVADRLRLVRSIAPARPSCLVQSKGQPSATMVGIDAILGEFSPFQVHRSFSMLIWCGSTMR
jgi:hypothetical protein